MPRTYQPTGNRPGAPDGNQNAVTHGFHSAVERAERLRAESTLRSVRALTEALALGERIARIEKQNLANAAEERQYDEKMAEDLRRNRDRPNFRGFLIELIRDAVAVEWMRIFPGETHPDWVYEWVAIQPNLNSSPAYEDGDDLAPGVPGEGYTPQKIPETTPPRSDKVDWFMTFHPGVFCHRADAEEVLRRKAAKLGKELLLDA